MRLQWTGVSLAPIGVLLLVACLIAMLTRRLGLPYIVGLVVAGLPDRAAAQRARSCRCRAS